MCFIAIYNVGHVNVFYSYIGHVRSVGQDTCTIYLCLLWDEIRYYLLSICFH